MSDLLFMVGMLGRRRSREDIVLVRILKAEFLNLKKKKVLYFAVLRRKTQLLYQGSHQEIAKKIISRVGR